MGVRRVNLVCDNTLDLRLCSRGEVTITLLPSLLEGKQALGGGEASSLCALKHVPVADLQRHSP